MARTNDTRKLIIQRQSAAGRRKRCLSRMNESVWLTTTTTITTFVDIGCVPPFSMICVRVFFLLALYVFIRRMHPPALHACHKSTLPNKLLGTTTIAYFHIANELNSYNFDLEVHSNHRNISTYDFLFITTYKSHVRGV